jgi:RNA polymerase primary sigma factor
LHKKVTLEQEIRYNNKRERVMAKRIHVSNGAIVATAESTTQLMRDIKKLPTLTKEQEVVLAERIQSGDRRAMNELVQSNIRFAIQVAKQYQGMGLQLEDLIGFANVGLFEAAERFDAKRGVKFITFAVWYIRAELQKALNDLSRTVRIPSHRTATEEYSTKSISTPVGDDDNKETYADRYLAADAVKSGRDRSDMMFDIDRALGQLKPKQEEALRRNYGIGKEYAQSMEQIGEEMGITNERARQLVRQAEIALQGLPGIKLLEQYL